MIISAAILLLLQAATQAQENGIGSFQFLRQAGDIPVEITASSPSWKQTIDTDTAGEAFIVLTIYSPDTSWRSKTEKGLVLKTYSDGVNYSDIVVFGGKEKLEYTAYVGTLDAGEHEIEITFDKENSPAPGGTAIVASAQLKIVPDAHPEYVAYQNSPILYLLDGQAVSDIPLLIFYSMSNNSDTTILHYTTVFSNEDGGTGIQPIILMAQWGRTTDIELICRAVIDNSTGDVLEMRYQSDGHSFSTFSGRRVNGHPVLRVSTSNGMFDQAGETAVKLAPMPVPFVSNGRPRPSIMDDYPWTFRIMNEEMFAEDKATTKKGPVSKALLSDARSYIYVDFTASNNNGKRTLEFLAEIKGKKKRYSSNPHPMFSYENNSGMLAKSGTYRTNIKIPLGARPVDVTKIIVRGTGEVDYNIKEIKTFMLGKDYVPEPYFFTFRGDVHLTPENREVEFHVVQ